MKALRLTILSILLLTASFFAFTTYRIEVEKIQFKQDLIELSRIKYGLFNVDEWKTLLTEIISEKIEEFNLDDTNREEMREKISAFLYKELENFEGRFYKDNSRGVKGFIKRGVASVTGTFKEIKNDVPIITEQILNFLDEEENREAIRNYLIKKLDSYADETFSKTDYSKFDKILNRYEKGDLVKTKLYLQQSLDDIKSRNQSNKMILVCIALASILFLAFLKNSKRQELAIGLAIGLVFLLLGVILPMIEIDARISNMSFSLLGEEVAFLDQVLYYKSKSILEVVELMIFQSRPDLIAVGLLVLTFSVLFPLSKLICSAFYLYDLKSRGNPFVSFMVLKSGKWSMADVMVIAIFMAYIGFDGIISEQLKQLEKLSDNLDLLTTNQSNLLFGFYSFTLFVFLSLISSQKIQASCKA